MFLLVGAVRKQTIYVRSSSCRVFFLDSVTDTIPLPGQRIDLLETPVAFASVDKGRVDYVGDVNGEKESDSVILEMLGWDV